MKSPSLSALAALADLVDPPGGGLEPREKQRAPSGDWRIWLLHPGRGWGKGFSVAHWLRDRVRAGKARSIALVGSTRGHVRQIMIEKEKSGILAVCPEAIYRRGDAEVYWPNGAKAFICSAEKADSPPLRGGDFDTAWGDEVDSWGLETSNTKAAKAWDNLTLSVRAGSAQMAVTSTPKPGRIVAALIKQAKSDETIRITTGSTYENAENLSAKFIADIERKYKGTRLERQEIYGEVLEAMYGALWGPESFQHRYIGRRDVGRVVVGVDPSGGGDMIGIVAACELCDVPDAYGVLDDWSIHGSPDTWARRTLELAAKWQADCIVAERNYGGDMVLSTLRAVDKNAPIRMVTASKGKLLRAEPISLLYDQKRVWHQRKKDRDDMGLDLLEDQFQSMTARGWEGEGSPDRLDAAVWTLTKLALEGSGEIELLFTGSGPERIAAVKREREEVAEENRRLEEELGLR